MVKLDDDTKLAALIGQAKVTDAKAIRLFANIELRTDVLVNGNRVNYHIIFSDEVSADDITDNFLTQLHFTSEGKPPRWQMSLVGKFPHRAIFLQGQTSPRLSFKLSHKTKRGPAH